MESLICKSFFFKFGKLPAHQRGAGGYPELDLIDSVGLFRGGGGDLNPIMPPPIFIKPFWEELWLEPFSGPGVNGGNPCFPEPLLS